MAFANFPISDSNWQQQQRIETSDIVQKGNTLTGKVSVTNYNIPFATKTSREHVIGGAVSFQVKVVTAMLSNGHMIVYNNLIFVQFLKRRQNDELNYTIKFTAPELHIQNKRFTSDDGTWHLIHENKRQQYTFEVSILLEVMSCINSFAVLHTDEELTDFELRGVDGSVHMHRAVMAASSPVLRRMLGGMWRETAEGCVDMPGTTRATLQDLKDYVYLGTLPESGLEELLLLSSYYMMPELEKRCVDKIVQNVTVESAFEVIEFAAKNKMTQLLLAVLDCVQSGTICVTAMRDHLQQAE